jgi:hypothetical protein
MREESAQLKARIAGVFYLVSVLTAVLAETLVHGRLLYAVGLVPVVCFTIVTLLLYGIFSPVSTSVSFLAASANLVGLSLEALELHLLGMNAALVFHGIYCLLIGYLVFRSTFLPRILGALMVLAGLGWLTSLSPPLAQVLSPYNQALGFLGEGALMLWLLVTGVNVPKWNQKASETIPSIQSS